MAAGSGTDLINFDDFINDASFQANTKTIEEYLNLVADQIEKFQDIWRKRLQENETLLERQREQFIKYQAEMRNMNVNMVQGQQGTSAAVSDINKLSAAYQAQKAEIDRLQKQLEELKNSYDGAKRGGDRFKDGAQSILGSLQALKDQLKFIEQQKGVATTAEEMKRLGDRANEVKKKMAELDDVYKEAANAGIKGASALQGSYNELIQVTNKLERELKQLPDVFGKNADKARQMQEQIAANRTRILDFDNAIKNFKTNIGNYQSAFDGLGAGLRGFGDNLSGGLFSAFASGGAFAVGFELVSRMVNGFADSVKDFVELQARFESLSNAITFASGSAFEGDKNLKFLNRTAKDLGLEIESTAEGFKQFASAASSAGMSTGETRREFTAVSKAVSVLGVSADDSKGIFLALSQILSKGKVSAEELRGQIGERLPGAFNIAAKAMGVTTQELDKMLSEGKLMATDFLPKFATELEKTFGSGVEKSANSLRANLNRISNGFKELFLNIGSASEGVLSLVVGSLATGLSAINNLLNPMSALTEEFHSQSETVKNLQGNITPLLDRYDVLKAKTSPTKSEQEELKKAIEGIGQAIPSAIVQVDAYGNALEINAGKARAFITRNLKISDELRSSLLTAEKSRLENVQREIRLLQSDLEKGEKYEITKTNDILVSLHFADPDSRNKKLTEEDYRESLERLKTLAEQAAVLRESIRLLEGGKDTPPPPPPPPGSDAIDKSAIAKLKAQYENNRKEIDLQIEKNKQLLQNDKLTIDERIKLLEKGKTLEERRALVEMQGQVEIAKAEKKSAEEIQGFRLDYSLKKLQLEGSYNKQIADLRKKERLDNQKNQFEFDKETLESQISNNEALLKNEQLSLDKRLQLLLQNYYKRQQLIELERKQASDAARETGAKDGDVRMQKIDLEFDTKQDNLTDNLNEQIDKATGDADKKAEEKLKKQLQKETSMLIAQLELAYAKDEEFMGRKLRLRRRYEEELLKIQLQGIEAQLQNAEKLGLSELEILQLKKQQAQITAQINAQPLNSPIAEAGVKALQSYIDNQILAAGVTAYTEALKQGKTGRQAFAAASEATASAAILKILSKSGKFDGGWSDSDTLFIDKNGRRVTDFVHENEFTLKASVAQKYPRQLERLNEGVPLENLMKEIDPVGQVRKNADMLSFINVPVQEKIDYKLMASEIAREMKGVITNVDYSNIEGHLARTVHQGNNKEVTIIKNRNLPYNPL